MTNGEAGIEKPWWAHSPLLYQCQASQRLQTLPSEVLSHRAAQRSPFTCFQTCQSVCHLTVTTLISSYVCKAVANTCCVSDPITKVMYSRRLFIPFSFSMQLCWALHCRSLRWISFCSILYRWWKRSTFIFNLTNLINRNWTKKNCTKIEK